MFNNVYKWRYLTIIFVVIVGYLFLYYSYSSLEGHTLCLFKRLTGIPCPACGSTRATVFLLHADFRGAFYMNPIAIITNAFIFIGLFWLLIDVLLSKRSFFCFLRKNWPIWLKIMTFTLIVINWCWSIYKFVLV